MSSRTRPRWIVEVTKIRWGDTALLCLMLSNLCVATSCWPRACGDTRRMRSCVPARWTSPSAQENTHKQNKPVSPHECGAETLSWRAKCVLIMENYVVKLTGVVSILLYERMFLLKGFVTMSENLFQVVDVMCPGSFGVTFFVEDRNSGLEYTLKKVLKSIMN